VLIDDYELALSTPDCDLASPVYAARVTFGADISEVLPYVNATVDKGEFVPGIPVLVWKEASRKYALRPSEIAISSIADREEAVEAAQELVRRINAIWDDRENMEPSFTTYERPKVLDVFKLLPRTNCRKCGVPTCMAYADMLIKEKRKIEDCPPLGEEGYAESAESLRDMGL